MTNTSSGSTFRPVLIIILILAATFFWQWRSSRSTPTRLVENQLRQRPYVDQIIVVVDLRQTDLPAGVLTQKAKTYFPEGILAVWSSTNGRLMLEIFHQRGVDLSSVYQQIIMDPADLFRPELLPRP